AIALVFGLLATPVVNAEEVSNEELVVGEPGNGKELVMPGDNVSNPIDKTFPGRELFPGLEWAPEAEEDVFLKAKKAFDGSDEEIVG
ncbi:hypothetical protein KGY79_05765, partial [Candidatus Bipolaricaulota bacterium]|nr:hypothetical protein [Candidatus Bipolaricaulota bacterium]